MSKPDLSQIVARRRARTLERFRHDERFFRLVQKAEREGVTLEPLYLNQDGYVAAYSRFRFLLDGRVCALYRPTEADRVFELKIYRLNLLEFATLEVPQKNSGQHYLVPVRDLQVRHPRYKRFTLQVPDQGETEEFSLVDWCSAATNWKEILSTPGISLTRRPQDSRLDSFG